MKSQLGRGKEGHAAMYTVLGTLSVDVLPLKSMCLKRQNATNGIHQMTFLKEPNRQHMKLSIIKHELIWQLNIDVWIILFN